MKAEEKQKQQQPEEIKGNKKEQDFSLSGNTPFESEAQRKESLPSTYQVSRDFVLNSPSIFLDLFRKEEIKEKGKPYISGVTQYSESTPFWAVMSAFAQILSNQSYLYKNKKDGFNLGTNEDGESLLPQNRESNNFYYRGTIRTTLDEITRIGHGVEKAGTQEKAADYAILEALNGKFVKTEYPNGDVTGDALFNITYFHREKSTRQLILHITLNPVFSYMKDGFGFFKQDYFKELRRVTKKITALHYKLSYYIAVQDQSKVLVRYRETLMRDLGLWEAYKKNPKRTSEKLNNALLDVKDAGLFSNVIIIEDEIKKSKAKIEIHFYRKITLKKKKKE